MGRRLTSPSEREQLASLEALPARPRTEGGRSTQIPRSKARCPVIIAIILWKVLPGDENQRAFLDFWAQTLELSDRSRLAGEYLSHPLSTAEAGLECSLLGLSPGDDYVPFFNVGIWE